MVPLQAIRQSVLVLTAGILSVLLILLVITPNSRLIAGFILGISVSLYNVIHLSIKTDRISRQILENRTRRSWGMGMMNRFLMVTLAMIVTYLLPHYFDYRTVILGLPVCYALLIPCYFWQEKRNQRG